MGMGKHSPTHAISLVEMQGEFHLALLKCCAKGRALGPSTCLTPVLTPSVTSS